MIAESSYNDLTGTSAMDLKRNKSLISLTQKNGINTERYKTVGFGISTKDLQKFSVELYLKDTKSTEDLILRVTVDSDEKEIADIMEGMDIVLFDKYERTDYKTREMELSTIISDLND